MINTKWIRTSSQIVCNEKEAPWIHITFHRKARFKTMRMPTKTPQDLDQYLGVNLRQMKVIDVDYNVRVGYWASRNNMQEYKITMSQ